MVNLRSRSALASVVTPVASNARLITQTFVGEKAIPQPRKRAKAAAAESTKETTQAADKSPVMKKSKKSVTAIEEQGKQEALPFLSREEVIKCTTIAYPQLPFRLSDAIHHLRSVDVRFHSLLDKIELTPYKELENGQVKELDMFRTLTTSVLGQQVSWLAARAILYRFIRLFFPALPEKPDFTLLPRDSLPFPHPIDVAMDDCTEERLRSAGLSGAKVKYIKDIARRFSDGRLDVRKIVKMQEEECIQELIKIKGVGKWTAEMLLIFALRRANILPVGDLGVQRGMVLFYLSDRYGPNISKRKKKKEEIDEDVKGPHIKREPIPVSESHMNESQIEVEASISQVVAVHTGPDVKAIKEEEMEKEEPGHMQPLPEGITYTLLKSRAEGKKAKGNVYLT